MGGSWDIYILGALQRTTLLRLQRCKDLANAPGGLSSCA